MNSPIFVLSLQKSTDRRERISQRLSELGLQFSFFDAIPVSELTQPQWASLIDREGALRKAGKQMTEAEFSCALSHALIYRKIIEEDHPHAFILEDDAILSDDFAALVSQQAFEGSGEDFVSFYYKAALVLKRSTKEIGRGCSLRMLLRLCDYATAYFLSQRGARFMWQNSIPIRDVADWGANTVRIGAKVTSPCLVLHPPEEIVPSQIKTRNMPKRPSNRARMGVHYIQYKFRKQFSEWIYSGEETTGHGEARPDHSSSEDI